MSCLVGKNTLEAFGQLQWRHSHALLPAVLGVRGGLAGEAGVAHAETLAAAVTLIVDD